MRVLWPLCPFRTVLFSTRAPIRMPDTPPSVALCMLVLGGEIESLSERMRTDVEAAIDSGEVVSLVSNSRAQRDHTEREIVLTTTIPAGSA
jgi:hypothetical protein